MVLTNYLVSNSKTVRLITTSTDAMLVVQSRLQFIQAKEISLPSTTIGGRSIVAAISVASSGLKLEFAMGRPGD
jgi:hypothetical protein